mmetsp:Transcript_12978/g.31328  ORF Transcript_12978/g.31328 Transcript_12978/m.31328 type:complete len:292 (-) Transcript_12978:237-1112(-)
MPPAAKHDSYVEQCERKLNPHTDFSRAHTPRWVLRKKAYKPLASTVPDYAIGNAFLPAVTAVSGPFYGNRGGSGYSSPVQQSTTVYNAAFNSSGRFSPEPEQMMREMTMRSESPMRDTMSARIASQAAGNPLSDTRSSRHIHKMMSSDGMQAKVSSYYEIEKKKEEVKSRPVVYQSPRWGGVARTDPFDRKSLPLVPAGAAAANPSTYYAEGDAVWMQSRAMLEMRTRSFTMSHGVGALRPGQPGQKVSSDPDPSLRRKMDGVSRFYENLASKQIPQLLRDRRAGLESVTT